MLLRGAALLVLIAAPGLAIATGDHSAKVSLRGRSGTSHLTAGIIAAASSKPAQAAAAPLPFLPLALVAWASLISVFMCGSYFFDTPPPLLRVPRRAWALVHALTTTLTSGVIVISAAIEALVLRARDSAVLHFWFNRVPTLDAAINLPALTMSMVSGVAIAAHKYGHFSAAPSHVIATVELLVVFACWWGAFDVRTQQAAQREIASISSQLRAGAPYPVGLRSRNRINLVSCVFVLGLYVLMVIKPDVSLPWRPPGYAQRVQADGNC